MGSDLRFVDVWMEVLRRGTSRLDEFYFGVIRHDGSTEEKLKDD
jgi:hypothetical protein